MARLVPAPLPPLEAPDEERALVRRARSGDPAAFRTIFERFRPAVRRFLGDLLRDEAAAEEATQETFVRAHQRLPALRDDDRLRAWLFGVARNVYFEHHRAMRGRAPSWEEEGGEPARIDAILPTPTPEALLLDRELEQVVASALGELSEARRAALVLRIDHGLPYDEIASVMGWTLSMVKNEIHRARLQLRLRLAGHLGGRT